ncbi:MAG TPA: MraY family glycosyltransferase [Bryobacteraceae bacterium]|nr:MraY family glycosyltransferase [Bryobacteraceae bacterium]
MLYVLLSLGLFGFLAALNVTPVVRDLAVRFGIVDHPDNRRKLHHRPIPRVGGIAIFVSYLLAFAATAFGFLDVHTVLPQGSMAAGFFASLVIVFATGLLDDLVNLRPWQKLGGQVLAALTAYFSGVQIHLFRGHPLEIWFSLPFTIIWLIGCTNAFNLIDGLDGLAAGVGLFATVTTIIAALTQQDLGLCIMTIPLAGCLLGFLRYNFNPASIFLGDCGSLSIGFFLGCCGVLWGQKSATLLGMAAPLMAMAIPLLDVCVSIFRRFLRNQPIFGADRRHIHHLLLDRGLTPRRAALLLYGICAIAAAFSLLQAAARNQFGGVIVIVFCAAAWIGVQHLGYSEFGLATRLLFKGSFRQTIDVQFRLQQFERSIAEARTLDQCWQGIQTGYSDFGFSGVRMQAQGRIFEQTPDDAADHCQIRIPLRESQYVNLYRSFQTDVDPTALAGFARILQTVMTTNLERFDTQIVTQMEAETTTMGQTPDRHLTARL